MDNKPQVKIVFYIASTVQNIPFIAMPAAFQDLNEVDYYLDEESTYVSGLIAQFVLKMIVEATTMFALEKFLLEPLLDVGREKWEIAVNTLLNEFPNKRLVYRLFVHLNNEDLIIEVSPIVRQELSDRPLELDKKLIIDVWGKLKEVFDILGDNHEKFGINKIQIVVSDKATDVICYVSNKPSYLINIGKKTIIPVTKDFKPPKFINDYDLGDEIKSGMKLIRKMKTKRKQENQ